jgi:hypothetical protein
MAQNKKCAHPACGCEARKDNRYCSQYCQDAGGTLELTCACGHAGCTEKAATGSPISS